MSIEMLNRTGLAMTSLWDAADQLGSITGGGDIPRPAYIATRPQPLSRKLWPDCALCGLDVVRCDCDPDAAQAAGLAKMLAERTGAVSVDAMEAGL